MTPGELGRVVASLEGTDSNVLGHILRFLKPGLKGATSKPERVVAIARLLEDEEALLASVATWAAEYRVTLGAISTAPASTMAQLPARAAGEGVRDGATVLARLAARGVLLRVPDRDLGMYSGEARHYRQSRRKFELVPALRGWQPKGARPQWSLPAVPEDRFPHPHLGDPLPLASALLELDEGAEAPERGDRREPALPARAAHAPGRRGDPLQRAAPAQPADLRGLQRPRTRADRP